MRFRLILFSIILFHGVVVTPVYSSTPEFPPPTKLVQQIIAYESFVWDSTKTDHFVIYYLQGSHAERNLGFLKEKSEEALSRAVEVLDLDSYSTGIRLFMLESREQMFELLEMRPKAIALYEHDAILMVFNENVRPYLTHEVFHIVSIKHWGMPETWIREGSAVFADGQCLDYTLDEIGAYLVKTEKAVSLRSLIDDFGKTDDMITYLQSASLFKYIYEHHSIEQVRLFWQGGSAKSPETLDLNLQDLDAEWRAFLIKLNFAAEEIDWERLMKEGCG